MLREGASDEDLITYHHLHRHGEGRGPSHQRARFRPAIGTMVFIGG